MADKKRIFPIPGIWTCLTRWETQSSKKTVKVVWLWRFLVRVVGLKPTSLAVPNRAFYQLNYTRIFSFLHDTTQRRKKQVFRVCGQRCGQARFYGSFSTGGFSPQATVPRTSGISLSGEWIGRLSSQIKRNTTFTISRYSMFHFTFDTYQQTGILFAHRLTIS